jgi:hypothetical protein
LSLLLRRTMAHHEDHAWEEIADVLTGVPGPEDLAAAESRGPGPEDLEYQKIWNRLSLYKQERDVGLATDCTGIDAPRVGMEARLYTIFHPNYK